MPISSPAIAGYRAPTEVPRGNRQGTDAASIAATKAARARATRDRTVPTGTFLDRRGFGVGQPDHLREHEAACAPGSPVPASSARALSRVVSTDPRGRPASAAWGAPG